MNTEFPRITTRGNYDLWTGKRIKTGYRLYPKHKFNKIFKSREVVIFIHGMRNSRWGAQNGGKILRRKLRKLGYAKHPVIVFSYDADVREAHKPEKYNKVLKVADRIAKENGHLLRQFLIDFSEKNPAHKIHLVGHSLGCEVVVSCLQNPYGRPFESTFFNIDSVHLFGSPVEVDDVVYSQETPFRKLINYVNKKDDVIQEGVDKGNLKEPSCLNVIGLRGSIHDKRCNATDHRFKSYVEKLRRFP